MIKKGDVVIIKPEFQDEGDDQYTWVAVSDEDKGRFDVSPMNIDLKIIPVMTMQTDWITKR